MLTWRWASQGMVGIGRRAPGRVAIGHRAHRMGEPWPSWQPSVGRHAGGEVDVGRRWDGRRAERCARGMGGGAQ